MALDLKEVVSILHGGDWCSITFITANVKKGTGGKVIELPKCRIARRQPALDDPGDKTAFNNLSKKTPVESRCSGDSTVAESHCAATKRRDPNHNLHFTRNVELPNKRIVTIHPILILRINQKSVL